jgi:DNA polymerase-3 subunit alpha
MESGVRQFSALSGENAWTEPDLLQAEKETLGFYFSSHPLISYMNKMQLYTTCQIEGLRELSNNGTVTVGGISTAFKEITTKKGQRMAFVTIEDLSASVEVVIFSDVYKKCSEFISGERPLLVLGKLDKNENEVKLIATEVVLLDEAGKPGDKIKVKKTHILFEAPALKKEKLLELKAALQSNPGSSPVFLHLLYPDDREVVLSTSDEFRISPAEEMLTRLKGLGIDIRFT